VGDLIQFPNGGASPRPRYSLFPTMFCSGCGADRVVAPSAADPGPCPSCGGTSWESSDPATLTVTGLSASGFAGPVEFVTGNGSVFAYPPPPA